MKLPYIPEDAPFSGDQRAWLGGFLAGLHSRAAMGGAAPAAVGEATVQAKPLHILFGTQTGNAEEVANEAATLARTRGFAPRLEELDAISPAQLAQMEHVIIAVSTYGEGEMPDNAGLFWEALSSPEAPRLESLKYGVLGLGDTSYDDFCQAAKLIDMRLEQLGAKRLGERVDCDVDYEEVATAWLQSTLPAAESATAPVAPAPSEKLTKSGWSRKTPYRSRVVDNRILSGAESAKEIRHIAFSLGDSGMSYEAGDALGVMPVNNPDYVQAILSRLGVPGETAIAGHDAPLSELLTSRFEIATPSKDLIKALAPLSGDEEFLHVVKNGDKEALDAWLWGRDLLDVLELNPTLPLDPAELVSWLKPLQHRAYSISSSPKAHKGEVHLTVAAVRWNFNRRPHRGVCSTFLADFVPEGAQAGIFMSPNKAFRVPVDDTVPMIMVGPGTGIAPFRAFLEERRARGAKGANWLFFGDQHRKSDFIYEDEISAMSASGLLTRLDLAFSRDQAEKIYVQNRMTETGRDLYAMLEEGGHFYVCGDATRMARDVDAALHSIIETQGGMTPEAATDYVNRLKRDKRYVRDVY
ncbi:diflavin oxidoreductase [Mangrovicoccus algicola]|uniref:assimilatory sulfite reductase (NADPH) n=1 Tax=Mangrovicoccus algicola TaxID=2771008 RepID=A0A8J7CIJ2_9RHOB|nr:sulfite reductase flavoprotein subunit alpha [Mangrovicoccus algicola]MBE3639615.1 sulfite reductase flavoprotein subunit alpha [Mangrovicoccus algicola]